MLAYGCECKFKAKFKPIYMHLKIILFLKVVNENKEKEAQRIDLPLDVLVRRNQCKTIFGLYVNLA